MKELETSHLIIRPFRLNDLDDIHRILDLEVQMHSATYQERADWLDWTIRNYTQLARLYQPPYGDRAVIKKASGEIIGAAGLVPSLVPVFTHGATPPAYLNHPEMGLYYAITPAEQGRGYATQAARALTEYAFRELRIYRIIATTDHTNLASQAVMRKLGMRIEINPNPEPEWFQVVGILDNPGS